MKHYSPYFKGEEKDMFNAMWQYAKDHCDVTPEGTFFVKFHVKDKEVFEKKIRSRMKGIHRDRTAETIAGDRKVKKEEKMKIGYEEMQKKLQTVKELNAERNFTLLQKLIRFFR